MRGLKSTFILLTLTTAVWALSQESKEVIYTNFSNLNQYNGNEILVKKVFSQADLKKEPTIDNPNSESLKIVIDIKNEGAECVEKLRNFEFSPSAPINIRKIKVKFCGKWAKNVFQVDGCSGIEGDQSISYGDDNIIDLCKK